MSFALVTWDGFSPCKPKGSLKPELRLAAAQEHHHCLAEDVDALDVIGLRATSSQTPKDGNHREKLVLHNGATAGNRVLSRVAQANNTLAHSDVGSTCFAGRFHLHRHGRFARAGGSQLRVSTRRSVPDGSREEALTPSLTRAWCKALSTSRSFERQTLGVKGWKVDRYYSCLMWCHHFSGGKRHTHIRKHQVS